MSNALLTTTDNPFDPFTQWDEWYAYDIRAGHFTLNYLARVTFSSPNLSEADQAAAIERGMDEIIAENVFGIHKKVFKKETQDTVLEPNVTAETTDL